jgi:hypothetical protein
VHDAKHEKDKRIEVGLRGRGHFGFFRVRVEAKIVAFKPHVGAIGAHPIPLHSMFSRVSERPEAFSRKFPGDWRQSAT